LGGPSVTENVAYVAKYGRRIEGSLQMSIEDFSEKYCVPVLVEIVRGRAW
jgi:hypothetical protein